MRTVLLTVVAMLAFAANSLLCRQALGAGLIDAASFTAVRVLAGAGVLALIVWPRWRTAGRPTADWRMVTALFVYMICFALAYRTLTAGTGALILFGAVQLTMFAVGLRAGESFTAWSWVGLALAAGGLVHLVLPGVTAPDAVGALLMAVAGVAWGGYSLLGRSAGEALPVTAANFVYAVPLALVAGLLPLRAVHLTPSGCLLAATSGAVASGLGYFVWYAAVRHLTAIRAAIVQLSVPVLAALGGVLLLAEQWTGRLAVSSLATLGGIALVLARRPHR